jgi:hypothetical protein
MFIERASHETKRERPLNRERERERESFWSTFENKDFCLSIDLKTEFGRN